MPDFIGPIEVPEQTPSGTFPLVSDYPHGVAIPREVAVHSFGSANRKIEQRFLIGSPAARYLFQRTTCSRADVKALREFFDLRKGSYQPFTYNAPSFEHGGGTDAVTVRFEDPVLSLEELISGVQAGLVFVEQPSDTPSFTVASTVTRFPSAALETELLEQDQEIIPLVRLRVNDSGVSDIFLSDRRVTVGGNTYLPRLLGFDGVSQATNGAADDASFAFGNADRVMQALAAAVNLRYARVEFSLFHVESTIKLDLWAGVVSEWSGEGKTQFRVRCSDLMSPLGIVHPARTISRRCWKTFDDGAACPFTAQGSLNTGEFPSADAGSCDKGFETPNGCRAHNMDDFHGGIQVEPQRVRFRGPGTFRRRTITSVSFVNDTLYGEAIPEVYTDVPLPVRTMLVAGRDESEFFAGKGIVGDGPIVFGEGHRLDGQKHHGPGDLGLITSDGNDPNPDEFGLSALTESTNVRAAGTAFIEIRRTDEPGVQLSQLEEHELIAVVAQGKQGWMWSGPGSRTSGTLTNPVWVAVNAWLRDLRLHLSSASAQEAVFDVPAAVAAAALCDQTVNRIVGDGTQKQFTFRGILSEQKPLRDWMSEFLANCLGYWTFSFNRLRLGIRLSSVSQEAFTLGNIVDGSLDLREHESHYNRLIVGFGERVVDSEGLVDLLTNHVEIYDEDAALEESALGVPLYREAKLHLAGTIDRDQAARIGTVRLREEVGGVTAQERREIRDFSFTTTVLALAVEPGMVVSVTHPDVPGGGPIEGRVQSWRLNPDWTITIDCRGTTDSMYDLLVGETGVDVEPDPLPDEQVPELRPPDVENFEAVENPFITADGHFISRIDVLFTPPDPPGSWAGVEIWARTQADPAEPWQFVTRLEESPGWFLWEKELADPPDTLELQARSFTASGRVNPDGPEASALLDQQPSEAAAAPNVTNVQVEVDKAVRIVRARNLFSTWAITVTWDLPTGSPDFPRLNDLTLHLVNVTDDEREELTTLAVDHSSGTPVSYRRTNVIEEKAAAKTYRVEVFARNFRGDVTDPAAASDTFVLGVVPPAPPVANFTVTPQFSVIGGRNKHRWLFEFSLPTGHADYDEWFHGVFVQRKPSPQSGGWVTDAVMREGVTSQVTQWFDSDPDQQDWDFRALSENINGALNATEAVHQDNVSLAPGNIPPVEDFVSEAPQDYSADGVISWRLRGSFTPPTGGDFANARILGNFYSNNAILAARRSDFAHSYWTKFNIGTISSNVLANPVTGATDADQIRENSADSEHFIVRTLDGYSGAEFDNQRVLVAKVVKNNGRNLGIRIRRKDNAVISVIFDLAAGGVVSQSGGIFRSFMEPLGDDWYLCGAEASMVTGATVPQALFALADGTSFGYQGNGSSGYFAWNAFVATFDPHLHSYAIEADGSYETEPWPLRDDQFILHLRAVSIDSHGRPSEDPPEVNLLVVPGGGQLNLARSATSSFASMEIVNEQLRPKAGAGLQHSGGEMRAFVGPGISLTSNQIRVALGGIVDNMVAEVSAFKITAGLLSAVEYQLISGAEQMTINGSTGFQQYNSSASRLVRILSGQVAVFDSTPTQRTWLDVFGYRNSNSNGIAIFQAIQTSAGGPGRVELRGGSGAIQVQLLAGQSGGGEIHINQQRVIRERQSDPGSSPTTEQLRQILLAHGLI